MLRQGKRIEKQIRESGIPVTNVRQRDRDGVFVAEFWANTEDPLAAPTKPALEWAQDLAIGITSIVDITELHNLYAPWRSKDHVLCATVYFITEDSDDNFHPT